MYQLLRLQLIPKKLFKIAKKKNGLEYRENTYSFAFLGENNAGKW